MAEHGSPAAAAADGSTIYRNLLFPATGGVRDLTTSGGLITGISQAGAAAEFVCLPPLADLHVHANRAYTPPERHPRGLEDAVRQVEQVLETFTAADYRRHAGLLFDAAWRKGTARIRTHADVGRKTQLAAVEGSLAAAGERGARMDIATVAFAGASCDPATEFGARLLRQSIELGARYLGAVPAFCDNPRATIDAILDLSAELDVPVDLHLDEHLDADSCQSGYLATAVIDRGLQGRVTLGHGCAISALEPVERERVIDRLAEAAITVIVLPRTNLYLQDAGDVTPRLRGIAPVRELLDAGVPVRFASDNVRDAFYPYGDADLLGVAMDGILVSQLADPAMIIAAICDGRDSPKVGERADMLLVPGATLDAVLADPPRERWLLRAGEPLQTGD